MKKSTYQFFEQTNYHSISFDKKILPVFVGIFTRNGMKSLDGSLLVKPLEFVENKETINYKLSRDTDKCEEVSKNLQKNTT